MPILLSSYCTVVLTDGIDLSAEWALDTGIGTITPFLKATMIQSYDIDDPTLGPIDALGVRNFHNIGSPSVENRANFGVRWAKDNHSANIIARPRHRSEC